MKDRISIDEAPLREWILRAYQDSGETAGEAARILAAVRTFLSGVPGAPTELATYKFEESPTESIREFVLDMEAVHRGLSRKVFSPLLAAAGQQGMFRDAQSPPNLSLYVSSLAGSLAVKSGIDETQACALLASALLAIVRLGNDDVESAIALAEQGVSSPYPPEEES